MVQKINSHCLVLACAISVTPAIGQAASVTFDFTADFAMASADLIGATSGFGPISGSYTFDSTTPNSTSSVSGGVYPNAINALSFTDTSTGNVGSLTSANIDIQNVSSSFGGDSYSINSGSTATVTSSYGSATLTGFHLDLEDPSGAAFSNTALPTSPPELADFDTKQITLDFLGSDGFTTNSAFYTLTSLTDDATTTPGNGDSSGSEAAVIPLPAGLPLLLGALGAFSLVGARRKS